MTRTILMASAVALALTGCQQYGAKDNSAGATAAMNGAADSGDASAAIKAVEGDMLVAFKAKDDAKLTSHYASDAVLAVPGFAAHVQEGLDSRTSVLDDELSLAASPVPG